MAAFLQRIRNRIPPQLIGDRAWEITLEHARNLPVTVAALPFGFELPLHDPRAIADFGVSVIGGGQSAAFLEEKGQAEGADAASANVAWLLGETEPEESILRRIVGRKLMLEYDIDTESDASLPAPGIFLYPEKSVLAGGGGDQQLRDLRAVVDAVAHSAGLDLSDEECRQIERVYRAAKPDTWIQAVGGFPERSGGIRLSVMGFRKVDEVVSFLERVGWPGQCPAIAASASPLEERDAFTYMGVHLDMREGGVGETLGLNFYAREGEWLKDVQHWVPLIDGIRDAGLAVPEKLTELMEWASGSEPLSGKSGQFVLMRGIHHVKLTLVRDRVEKVKGYIFLLVFAWPLAANLSK